jgi:hypothetical protein
MIHDIKWKELDPRGAEAYCWTCQVGFSSNKDWLVVEWERLHKERNDSKNNC